MYTDQMRSAFRSLAHLAPKGFKVTLVDNEHFITIKAAEADFLKLSYDDKLKAVEYMIRSKKALEENGAIVLLVREGGQEL
jgi:hypothetical protein